MSSTKTEPGEFRDFDELILTARGNGQRHADTVRLFGDDAPQVLANAEFGLDFSSGAGASAAGLEALERYRGLVTQPDGSGWMDNTTLLTAVTLISDDGVEAMTPLTVWDLATFVRAVVSYERIYHHAHPQVDDQTINQRLGHDVLCPLPLPVQPSHDSPLPEPWEGPHRFMCDLWSDAFSWLRRLSASSGKDTLDGRELSVVLDAWRHALHRSDIAVGDLTDWEKASTRWTSPSNRLLQEIAAGTRVQDTYMELDPSPASRQLAELRAEAGLPATGEFGALLTDHNLRAYINQRLADFFQLPYLCGAARVPFRKHLYDRAVAIQHRLTALDVIDDRYAELAAGVQLRLPVFLAGTLSRAGSRDEIWGTIGEIRQKAKAYRKQRKELDAALARRDAKEVARVSKALSANVENVLLVVGKASVRASVAAVEQIAKGDVVGVAAGVAGVEAASRELLSSSLGDRLIWRLRRPHLLWINNVIDEAQQLVEAAPDFERLWQIPEKEMPTFTDRFREMAMLQDL
jgi:hypothetical protein